MLALVPETFVVPTIQTCFSAPVALSLERSSAERVLPQVSAAPGLNKSKRVDIFSQRPEKSTPLSLWLRVLLLDSVALPFCSGVDVASSPSPKSP